MKRWRAPDDGREWTVETDLIVRRGWRVRVRCQGFPQGCWGEFATERAAIRYGWYQARRLSPLIPPGREDGRRGAVWA